MAYYEVGIGVERHWDSGIFTYSSEQEIKIGTLVRVPFGKKNKLGVVIKAVKKPAFATKDIQKTYAIAVSEETERFMQWYERFYGAASGQVLGQFLPNYVAVSPYEGVSTNNPTTEQAPTLELSDEQKQAVEKIESDKKPTILHGITGAGKTRIYIQLLLNTLQSGKSALLLYPEIALTPQIQRELEKYAPVIAFHSQLSDKERSRLWYEVAQSSTPIVVIGPRSALFLPHKNLGLVVIDEAHEPSYKQDSDIRYSSTHVAAGLANSHNAKLVLGSATPPIVETEQIMSKNGQLVCLHSRPLHENTPKKVSFVDARNRELFSKHPLLSDELLKLIEQTLQNKKQVLLFINRRGTAKVVLCQSPTCDWQAHCGNCDLPMTFHHDVYQLVCHTCGAKQSVPLSCPTCGSQIDIRSLGSKALEDDIAKLFPQAKIGRYDTDTSKKASFAQNYTEIRDGDVDILVGTQQLAKGLDLPKLAVVGILNADLSLHFPDFSSDERTFQLIAQVMGRVGRGHIAGTVVLQTFQPNNPVLRLAAEENWHDFKDIQLIERKKHAFPPYSYYLKVIFREKSETSAYTKAEKYAKSILQKGVMIDGPMPSFYPKRNGYYYVQAILKSTSRASLLAVTKTIPKETLHDLDPTDLL